MGGGGILSDILSKIKLPLNQISERISQIIKIEYSYPLDVCTTVTLKIE